MSNSGLPLLQFGTESMNKMIMNLKIYSANGTILRTVLKCRTLMEIAQRKRKPSNVGWTHHTYTATNMET